MTDRINDSKNQPIAYPCANLFYLLQQLSRTAEVKECKLGSDSPVSEEPIAAYQRRLSLPDRSIQTDVLTSGWSRDAL
jgi:hypothetical protein